MGTSIGNTELSNKEQKRIHNFVGRIALLDTLPVKRGTLIGYKRAIAMSVLAYGWVFRVPTGTVMYKCARQMMGKSLREGSWHLNNVIEGGVVHPLVVLRLFNLTFGARQGKESMEAF